MKNASLYLKTVDILVQAYFNDTLEHQNCYACAVGNLIAANDGLAFDRYPKEYSYPRDLRWRGKEKYVSHNFWVSVFFTDSKEQEVNIENYIGEAKRQIEITGYSLEQLMGIEYAFETARKGKNDDEYMFNGLCKVLDALDIIHENTDSTITASNKAKFIKAKCY